MYETAEDLVELQRALDESYASAGEHLRSIFVPERRSSADDKVGDLFDGVVLHPQDLKPALDTFGVKASRDDISRGRVRKRVPAKKRRRSA